MHTVPQAWRSRPVQSIQDGVSITTMSRAQLYRLAKKGELELVKIGERKSAITTASIVRFFEKRGISVEG